MGKKSTRPDKAHNCIGLGLNRQINPWLHRSTAYAAALGSNSCTDLASREEGNRPGGAPDAALEELVMVGVEEQENVLRVKARASRSPSVAAAAVGSSI